MSQIFVRCAALAMRSAKQRQRPAAHSAASMPEQARSEVVQAALGTLVATEVITESIEGVCWQREQAAWRKKRVAVFRSG